MAEKRKRERLYSDKEISALIQRATELQEQERASEERGLSLQEIEHIAAEIGIDPVHLRRALIELENHPADEKASGFWGGPFRLDQKRVVEGTLTEEQWEQIVRELRRLTGSEGRIQAIGQAREWTRTIKEYDFQYEQTSVTVSPKADQTTIEVRKNYRGGALVTYLLGLVGSVTVAGIFLDGSELSDVVNTLIVSGSGIGGITVARASIAYWSKRQRQKVKQLMDWLHDTISQPEPDVSAEPQQVGLLELEEDELQPAVAGHRPRARS